MLRVICCHSFELKELGIGGSGFMCASMQYGIFGIFGMSMRCCGRVVCMCVLVMMCECLCACFERAVCRTHFSAYASCVLRELIAWSFDLLYFLL